MKVVHSEVLVPAELGAAARAQLIDDLYRVHVEIFDGVDRAGFAAYVVESPADRTSILVHRDGAGAIVGYFAGHEFHRTLHGRACVVLRGEAGLLRAFRGSGSNLRFGLGVAARLVLGSPNRPVYYLGCLVHPSSYYQLARYVRPVWPSREAQPDDATRAFMAELADSFKLKCVADDPLVRQVGWRTRDSEAERGYWQRSPRPEARFFREANPGYGEGHGLVSLAPLNMASISGAIARIAGEGAARNLSTARDSLRRLPVLSRWLGPAEIARHLRAAPLFEGLGEAQIAALTARAEVVQAPAGRVLFTRGDIGGDLYIIVSGGVQAGPGGGAGVEEGAHALAGGRVVEVLGQDFQYLFEGCHQLFTGFSLSGLDHLQLVTCALVDGTKPADEHLGQVIAGADAHLANQSKDQRVPLGRPQILHVAGIQHRGHLRHVLELGGGHVGELA